MAHETILIVDDERDILELLSYNLKRAGYQVLPLESGEPVVSTVQAKHPDLVILDLMLPGIDGIEVCRQLRSQENLKTIPIIMLTARSDDTDIISGLETGADDYISKPFSPNILIARVQALLRRRQREPDQTAVETVISIHDIIIDIGRHEVSVAGDIVDLSASEFSILEFLASNPGWVYNRGQIIEAVKGSDYPVTERSVDVQILGLRKKLGEKGECIETVRGVGYKMRKQKN